MKNRIININRWIPLLLFAFIMQACTDDFLEQTNPNKITVGNFWQNITDLDAGLTSVYSALKDTDILGIPYESTRVDYSVPSSFRQNSIGTLFYFQNFDLTTKEVGNRWVALYLGIFRANQVIENYEKLKPTFTDKTTMDKGYKIVAEARAIRGYLYYLLNAYYNNGSVPLLDFVPKNIDEFQQAMSTSQAVKDFYREDLQYGLDSLPKTYSDWETVGSNNLGRVTGGFCEAMLGKSYLIENDFPKAATYFKNVIENYGYSLTDNISKCVTGVDEFNTESIFEINYTTDLNLTNDGEETFYHNITALMSQGNVQPSSWITLKYRDEKIDPADPENMHVGADIYDTATGEVIGTEDRLRRYSIRASNSIAMVDDIDTPYYGVTTAEYGNAAGASPLARTKPNLWKKFTHWNTIGGGLGEDRSINMNNKSGINISVIRLAEVYLSYAECMIEQGDLTEALKYINRIRKRSHLILLGKIAGAEFANAETTYMDDIDLDSSNGEEEVTLDNLKEHLRFTEYPLELALEEERALNLRRWGVFKTQLENIASIKYDYWSFDKNFNGKHGDRYKCFITISGEAPTTYTSRLSVTSQPTGIQDMIRGAENFDENTHSYYPIPLDEVTANLKWNQTK
ncbi:RagB/SusD family nutrient uptake outer membrane protein [Wenyingzhuangia sp. 2_MG-2023]|uniref:RagB/SusD family nutrient uptake outer membrane protein n=1 Tax=Wenyingzhuangia sp. 2_MG-2023 TaxID=3062639 RepID=UPI0026E2E225|nr:RagB/SusD family nutrient uptake outer membrane protein [Wenyingzhuangia sp. 2_MG-2023]MDO6736341.1 RagB/SusD family nutrient uptake outer membrane protein [Wenyingzhuangia sp. 2_MG-2023]